VSSLPTPYYDRDGITIYCGDSRTIVPRLTEVYALVTDPPYGIEAAKKKAHSSIRDNPHWPNSRWDDIRKPETLKAALAISEDAAVWGGNYYTDILPVSSGWLAWIKPEAESGFSLADMELCWTNRSLASRVKHHARRDGNDHPTQKPLAVMRWTISFIRGPIILDPFMGSGTTLRAAKDLGRRAIGIEIEERYCEIAVRRLQQSVMVFA
jgi:site-specific DNA-methyltransferase (adenine-specific)